jgi:hypothetical protein
MAAEGRPQNSFRIRPLRRQQGSIDRYQEQVMSKTGSTILRFLILSVVWLILAGCSEKTVVVEQEEQRHESEAEMVSPGVEVVE